MPVDQHERRCVRVTARQLDVERLPEALELRERARPERPARADLLCVVRQLGRRVHVGIGRHLEEHRAGRKVLRQLQEERRVQRARLMT